MSEVVTATYDGAGRFTYDESLPFAKGQRVIIMAIYKPKDEDDFPYTDIVNKAFDDSEETDNFIRESKEQRWQRFLKGLYGFTDDFMPDGRDPFMPSEREEL